MWYDDNAASNILRLEEQENLPMFSLHALQIIEYQNEITCHEEVHVTMEFNMEIKQLFTHICVFSMHQN